ncbi:class I SAM-dependent methyltransferase [candidate division WWE3 bacterium]|nr:class I SAM-dependent methyltransferase [candidate division WWE3 bacterium]
MTNIANYDQSGYDYTKYWNGRQYEHEAENRALSQLLPTHGEHLLDLGGSFGRLMDVYAPRFDRATIMDYSKLALKQANENAKAKGYKNIDTVFGDAYNIPYPDNTFDAITMIRVLHHIEDPKRVFSEIHRILKPNGIFILDVPNKNHLKAQIRAILSGDISYLKDKSPIKHTTTKINGEEGIFYNFNISEITKLLTQSGLIAEQKKSVSNLRIPLLKKIFTADAILIGDQRISPVFTVFNLGPSVWIQSRKQKW